MLSDVGSLETIDLRELERSGSRTRGVFTGKRVFMCKAEFAVLLEHALCGYPISTAGAIIWADADEWPDRQDATCRGVEIAYMGTKNGDGRDALRYTYAKLTATYSNSFDGVSGTPKAGANDAPTQESISSASIGAQMVCVSKKGLDWEFGGTAVPPDVVPSKSVFHQDVSVPITNSPKKPKDFRKFVGKINKSEFLEEAAENVLYLGAEVSQKRLTVPAVPLPAVSGAPPKTVVVWDYVHKFAVRDGSWNKFYGNPNVDDMQADFLIVTGTTDRSLPYGEPIDLNEMFTK
ncbi:MAG: hypothetical protein JSS51_04405 [Planctomycetes bacterium]|nr:hypothetical protein [Planctomycetota bacterium]